ncbi:Helicase associated domain protein [Kitasatospora sp. NPDC001603]|uniref:helicase associated domain-containing protein n=1 Tax=Kitasatospora sp. NPDC001603 TaxID=3154388 RepID=UPI0033205A7D
MDPEPDVWEIGMANTQLFFDTHGHVNVPSNHIAPDGFHLGCWLGYQRALKAAGDLSATRAAALATCNMAWAHPKDSTETYLEAAQAYAAQHGHLLPEPGETYRGRPLGQWLAEQRRQGDADTLPGPYRRALKDIDPWWNPAWPEAWQRMCSRARTRSTGLTLSPGPLPRRANALTRWLDQQFDTFPELAKEQQVQLAALPLHDNPLAIGLRRPHGSRSTTHAQGLRAARRFYREHRHLRVPAGHVDEHLGTRFPLGQWVSDLRTMATAGGLGTEETASVEALGMQWTIPAETEDAQEAAPENLIGIRAGNEQNRVRREGPDPADHPTRRLWMTCHERLPADFPDLLLYGGGRQLIDMPAGAGKTLVASVTADRTQGRACLVLGPDPAYLQAVVKTWRLVRHRSVAGINLHPTRSGRKDPRLTSATQLADWMAQHASEVLVVARYQDAELIAQCHRDHRLAPWDHLVVEDAHRTAEGSIGPDHPHAPIHYDDGIVAYNRLYLTATPRIPHEIPTGGKAGCSWTVDMPAQEIFGTHQRRVERRELVDQNLLSPYQVIRTRVPETPTDPWRAQVLGLAHVIEQHSLRRVVAVLENPKEAQSFASRLAWRMLDANILIPSQGTSRRRHDQPVIWCQTAGRPMPSDLDAIALPSDSYTTMGLVDTLAPLMGQHAERAPQTMIIVPEPFDLPAGAGARRPAVMRRIAAALWAHDPTGALATRREPTGLRAP